MKEQSKKQIQLNMCFWQFDRYNNRVFDFYIYANAAVLVFLSYFSSDDSALATLQSLATFSIAFYHDH
jgi:hypothetical protein